MSQFEHVTPSIGYGENIKVVSQAWGDKVTATDRSESAGENVRPAGLMSTAPYKDPAEFKRKVDEETKAVEERAMKAYKNSVANLGPEVVRRPCAHGSCRQPARRESDYCRWHQPLPEVS